MDMINRITLLLFIGLAWGQVEQDKLVLKDGTKYLGEFSTIDGKNVLFKPEGAFGFQPISINKIKTLELSDGWLLIRNGRKLISRNEYQALSIEEKAQYDARILKPMTKWLRAGFLSVSSGMVVGGMVNFLEPLFFIVPAAGLIITYSMFGSNVEVINYPVELKSDKEKELYNNAYIKEVKRLRIISMSTGHLAFYGIIIIAFVFVLYG